MISPVNPYGVSFSISQVQKAMPYTGMKVVVFDACEQILQANREFLRTYDPKKWYIAIEQINTQPPSFVQAMR